MSKWIESNKWKAFKEIFSVFKDVITLVIAIGAFFWGTNVLKDQDRRIDNTKLSVSYLKSQIDDQAADSNVQVTEPKVIPSADILSRYNITLSDSEAQISQVQEWLQNPYSGYPALVEATRRVLGNTKLIGNPVPLTTINARNLMAHGRGTESPIISAGAIDSERLKNAIYASWAEKNSGGLSNNKSFKDIVVPIQ
ncbi:MAG: hypothetical protein FDX18_10375 [Chlorobium sp.]|nr:MAG: hypothetical protein FDX18_10375 [Chlorobium sp.]